MATYLVRRGLGLNSRVLKLGDREIPRGAEVDTADFPEYVQADWERWEQHRFIESVSARDDERRKAADRQAREMARVRGDVGPVAPEEAAAGSDVACASCEFVAKTPHGLKVHAGRKH